MENPQIVIEWYLLVAIFGVFASVAFAAYQIGWCAGLSYANKRLDEVILERRML